MAEVRPPQRARERLHPVVTAQILSAEQQRITPHIETVIKTNSLVLLTGTSHPKLAHKIGQHLGEILHEPIVVYEATSQFPDGEVKVNIEPNLRNREVFFIQGAPGMQSKMSVNDAVAEVEYAIDAAVRASAAGVNVLTPYSFYSRQDRKDRPRASISAAAVARKYEALGADRIVTMDLHAEQEQGFAQIPWDNLYASHVLIPEIQKLGIPNLVVASPDAGGVKRAEKYAELLQTEDRAVIFKQRDVNDGSIKAYAQIIGDVKGKPVLIVDDIIGSAKTAKQALELLKAHGATDVYLAVAHGVFTDDAIENLKDFTHVFFTDSVNHEGMSFPPNMTEVSVAPLFAEVIKRIHTGESISKGLISPSTVVN